MRSRHKKTENTSIPPADDSTNSSETHDRRVDSNDSQTSSSVQKEEKGCKSTQAPMMTVLGGLACFAFFKRKKKA